MAAVASSPYIALGEAPVAQLPVTFGGLSILRVLFFLGGEFTEIPAVVGRLPKLYMLSFKANRLTKVAEGAISPSVCWLILSDNAIDTLPESLCKCVGMRKLLQAPRRRAVVLYLHELGFALAPLTFVIAHHSRQYQLVP